MRIVPPTPEGIALAADAIRADEVVAYPTETVYGLGANPFSEEAIRKLFEVKSRSTQNPVLLIVADDSQLREVAAEVSPRAAACAKAFWPGPLSMLFPKAARVPGILTAGRDKVCVRKTSCAIARDLCLAVGSAITSSSANPAGQPPARCLGDLALPGIALAIDGGILEPSPPSTVFDPDEGAVLRHGAIAEEALREVLGL